MGRRMSTDRDPEVRPSVAFATDSKKSEEWEPRGDKRYPKERLSRDMSRARLSGNSTRLRSTNLEKLTRRN
jgi:hypothetical protein